MNLNDTLVQIAAYAGLDAAALIGYAAEDTIGGYHSDPVQAKWPQGSSWSVEGQTLYALIRAVRPQHVLEIGTMYGASASHILAALDANGDGDLTSIDQDAVHGDGPTGSRERWTFVQSPALPWLQAHPEVAADFVFEDALHDPEGTLELLSYVAQWHGWVVSHDAMHYRVGPDVRAAWSHVYAGDYLTVLAEPSDCGLAVHHA